MTGRRLLELELIADGDADLDLKEACIEIRHCHKRIDDMLAAGAPEIANQSINELRARIDTAHEALQEATNQVLRMAKRGVRA